MKAVFLAGGRGLLRLGYPINRYIANYSLHMSDVIFDVTKNRKKVHQHQDDAFLTCGRHRRNRIDRLPPAPR